MQRQVHCCLSASYASRKNLPALCITAPVLPKELVKAVAQPPLPSYSSYLSNCPAHPACWNLRPVSAPTPSSRQALAMVLAARASRLAARVSRLAARVSRLAARASRLAARVSRLAARVSLLVARVLRLAARVSLLVARVLLLQSVGCKPPPR